MSVPTRVLDQRKKAFSLNLNQYRNAHHHVLSDAKKEFSKTVAPLLKSLPSLVRVRISYILYTRTSQLCDVANVCSIVDKFFSDCLVQEEVLPDDNRKHVVAVAYGFGGVDKDNPRVDVVIEKA